MDYAYFRLLWDDSLSEAGFRKNKFMLTETIDVNNQARVYQAIASYPEATGASRNPLADVSIEFTWRWSAWLAIRLTSMEEDLLTELLGEEKSNLITELPWMRVTVNLCATIDEYKNLLMPDESAWRKWNSEMTDRLVPLFPNMPGDYPDEPSMPSWGGAPVIQASSSAGGRLYLQSVSQSVWQGIPFQRSWKNLRFMDDIDMEGELDAFLKRSREAMQGFDESLSYLLGS